ncbi:MULTISPECIES: TRAP transporter large permease [Rhodobacterales]|uniref:TRAP transporter large permease protein n=1 Tax=Tritonibacter horizontis TaxID=1768241 RepID=A0A132C1N1_9RHOB|nr:MULTISPECIES: TRAP transporter large permease [Rhodobacterales]KUP94162.1 sialic acid TRAP transporter permease protein SiaT [Tritonibacter horizontis]NYI29978.1 tripartite ATP-independent transporter DctM subunit [Sulfitobacter geojensis]
MSALMIGWAGVAALFALLSIRTPIGVALMIVSIIGITVMTNLTAAFGIISALPFSFIGDWSLTAIPMFLLMGFIAASTGLTAGAFDLLRMLLARVPGGLASASVGACGLFAAASGSSIATTAAMSRIAVPEMLRANYHPSLATGVVAASGTLGSLIPPSILMVLYGIFTEQSIGQLFIAGLIPGVLSALVYMGMITMRCTLKPSLAPPVKNPFAWPKFWTLLLSVWPFPVLIFGVLGGIFGGFFTPTEAGSVGAFLALSIAAFRRSLTRQALGTAIRQTVIATSSIFFLSIGAIMFTRFMGLSGVPRALADGMLAVSDNQIIIIVMIAVLFVILGMVIDSIGLMLLTLPVLLPVLEAADVNLIWFGIITIKLLEIGLVTPPVGLNLYVLHGALAGRVKLRDIMSGTTWFIAMDLLTLILLIAFPAISLFLPSFMTN